VQARQRLAAAGIENAALDARVLLGHATGLDHAALIAADRRAPTPAEAARFAELIAARAARTPVAYLTGEKEFWGLAFAVGPAVLVPRPETEHLVEAALEHLKTFLPRLRGRSGEAGEGGSVRPPPSTTSRSPSPVNGGGEEIRILDLGTGSGALLVSILCACRDAFGVGLDCSEAAIEVARVNAIRHCVSRRAEFLVGDWGAALGCRFDLILANPPYLTTAELAGAQGELGAEPGLALDGGADGLAAYRAIAPALPRLLKPGGIALIELGAGQGAPVTQICTAQGASHIGLRRDLAGIERVLEARFG
jgi:release factor glutamine methyltransferase